MHPYKHEEESVSSVWSSFMLLRRVFLSVKYKSSLLIQHQRQLRQFTVVRWCCDSIMGCCFIGPVSIPTSTCWYVTIVRLPDDRLFWKYGFRLFVGQPSYENKSSSPSSSVSQSLKSALKTTLVHGQWGSPIYQMFICVLFQHVGSLRVS